MLHSYKLYKKYIAHHALCNVVSTLENSQCILLDRLCFFYQLLSSLFSCVCTRMCIVIQLSSSWCTDGLVVMKYLWRSSAVYICSTQK